MKPRERVELERMSTGSPVHPTGQGDRMDLDNLVVKGWAEMCGDPPMVGGADIRGYIITDAGREALASQ